ALIESCGPLSEPNMSKNPGHPAAMENDNSTNSEKIISPPALLIPRATGPRTPLGKERSKRNALKHGVFSTVVVLKDESRTQFDALLVALRNDLQPEGALEQLLVEKLATLFWRHRRLLNAEAAEISKGAEFVEWNEQESQRQMAAE